jgi:hypothetical protein
MTVTNVAPIAWKTIMDLLIIHFLLLWKTYIIRPDVVFIMKSKEYCSHSF